MGNCTSATKDGVALDNEVGTKNRVTEGVPPGPLRSTMGCGASSSAAPSAGGIPALPPVRPAPRSLEVKSFQHSGARRKVGEELAEEVRFLCDRK